MSGGPGVPKGPGLKPFGDASVALGKGVGASNLGVGLVHTSQNQAHQAFVGVSQARGGSNPFAGKPNTSVGVGYRFRF